jgi:5-methyltetrahydrofolate--homocysteine methyltransferase
VESDAAALTLKTTELIVNEFGVNITMGASNVSFGLPARSALNASFMAMAIQAGLTCPITNPMDPDLAVAVLAADLVMGKDEWGERWIGDYRSRNPA